MRTVFSVSRAPIRGQWYSGLTFLLISLLFLMNLSTAQAQESSTPVKINKDGSARFKPLLTDEEEQYLQQLSRIRVALIDNQPPLTMVQAGEPEGYLNDLLFRLAEALGLEVEFVPMSYSQSVEALQKGQLDLLNDYSPYHGRTSALLESRPVINSPFVVVGSANLPPIHSMADIRDRKLVMVEGFQQTSRVQEHYPEQELMLVDSIDEAYRALRSQDAAFYIDNATHAGFYLRHHLISDLRILGELPRQELGRLSLRFAINKTHPLLHSAIDKSLERLVKSGELEKLKEQWLAPQTEAPVFQLTAEEQAWLKQHPEIRVVLDPDWAPVEYRDRSGNYEGISLDYLSRIEAMLGITIHISEGLDWQEGVAAVKSRNSDMFASVAKTPQREAYLTFTRPYLHMPIRIFARDDVPYIGDLENLREKRIAVVENYAIHDWLSTDYPHLNLVPVETPVDGLASVADRDIDVFIGNVVTTNYYVKKHDFGNVREAGDTPYSNSQAMAVRSDWPIFASILQKALDAIPEDEKKNIFNRWVSLKFERTINYTLLWWVLFVALATIMVFVYWNRALDKQVAHRTHDLAESEARFRNIFEKNSSVMLLVNPDTGHIVEANNSAIDYYGYTADELIGMPISDINTLPPKQIQEHIDKARNEETNYFMFQHRLASGEARDVEVYSTPIYTGSGSLLFSIINDVTDRKRAEEHIAIQAHYDALTGLPNRLLALDRLAMYLRESDRSHEKTGVMFLDLDDFKKINDTMGHDVGDILLIEAGERIRDALRDIDTVGRLGGDEFIILVGHITDQSTLIPIAEKLLERFQQPFSIQNRELVLTASIGISVYPDDGSDAQTLLRYADSAMYSAKEQGRATYTFFTDAMNQRVSRRLNLEEQMNGALERGEFSLHYQPKIDISSGRILGVEALLRWNNPEHGAVSPAEFIPIAEQTGLIVPIGEFVIKEALQFITDCRKNYDPTLSIAVNLSPRQFRDHGLVDFIRRCIEEFNLPWNALELEITEGVLMIGLGYIEEAIETLSQQGAILAMDDFGTGYSSLSYLRHFPFNVLKIDRSFITGISANAHDLELVNATIAMGHNLGMVVVAEGVETQEQLNILRQHGCDVAQGYYFSRPVTPGKLMDQLSRKIQ
ncbi:EAL domain-containing protein [Thiohalophilus sp.]|uniref:EAL domain-containing protein n=1 Tax=Thiohalophilus sp. TaxID=3028392 RepID=UPI002ACD804E|nr:EAL domain-containing protein [Thiohalophilus sp.]MDZ7805315.1 EAL domain-containing protein [Thiohalophilus sp.]